MKVGAHSGGLAGVSLKVGAAAAASVSAPHSSAASAHRPSLKAEPDCEVCGKKFASFTCSGCASAHYCSKSCQVSHWKEHKKPCKEEAAAALKKERARQEALRMEAFAEKEKEEKARKARIEEVTNPPCAACGAVSFETCKNCMATHYCNRACQVKHWSVHKIPCKESPIYKANQEVAALK